MMELSLTLSIVVTTITITSFIAGFLVNQRRLLTESEHNVKLTSELLLLKDELRHIDQIHEIKILEINASYINKLAEAQRKGEQIALIRIKEQNESFSIQVRPYVSKFLDEGFFKTTSSVRLGYQYQLFVSGVPCFDPYVIIEEEYKEKKVDEEKIERLAKKALKYAETAISAKSGPTKALISLVRNPLILNK